MSPADEPRAYLKHASVLIVSDDPDLARSIVARWQIERVAPEITIVSSDIWRTLAASDHDLVVLGSIHGPRRSPLLSSFVDSLDRPVVYLADDERESSSLRASFPALLVVERREDWAGTLILLANEVLHRVEALSRAHRAERLAFESERQATLGRYMLDMRPSINNALTSVLGNADLLLLEPGQASENTREQILTIHKMALRLNEIMQRFSSLACEMQTRAAELEPVSSVAFHRG